VSRASRRPARADLPIIGWREWVALPALGIPRIKAKVDTGARSSALHAFDLERYRDEEGREMIRFQAHPIQRSGERAVEVVVELADRRRVRSSSGEATLRPVVVTDLELMGRRFPVEITLVRRDLMGFRMLLGRQAIRRRFLVDPGASFRGGNRPDAEGAGT